MFSRLPSVRPRTLWTKLSLWRPLILTEGYEHFTHTLTALACNALQHPKPLMWERLKWTERFSFVTSSQVQHVVADDLYTEDWVLYQWRAETDQTLTGVKRVRALMSTWGWSHQKQEEAVFISGSVDNIMTR